MKDKRYTEFGLDERGAWEHKREKILTVYRKWNQVQFSRQVVDDAGLEVGNGIIFFTDRNTGDVFFTVSDDEKACHLTRHTKGLIHLKSSQAVRTFLSLCDAQDMASFTVSKLPKVIKGRACWRIMIKRPRRKS